MSEIKNYSSWYDWIRVNCEKHFFKKNYSDAWNEVKRPYDPNHQLADQVGKFYYSLDPDSQNDFRKSLVNYALTLKSPYENFQIISFLIDLAISIDCYELIASDFFKWRIFKGIVDKIDSDAGVGGDVSSASLFNGAVRLMRHFCDRGDPNYISEFAYEMLESAAFPLQYTYLVFLALCKVKPDELFNHWLKVRQLHFQCVENSISDDGRKSALRYELEVAIGKKELVSFIENVVVMPDYCSEDEWLIDLLSNNGAGPLKLYYNEMNDSLLVCSDFDKTRTASVVVIDAINPSISLMERIRCSSSILNKMVDDHKLPDPQSLISLYYGTKFGGRYTTITEGESEINKHMQHLQGTGLTEAVLQ